MDTPAPSTPRSRRRWPIIGGAIAAMTAGAAIFAPLASAATVFTAGFEDGDIGGWSKSGGTWAVVSDGSQVARQSKADAENARLFNAPTNLTDYTVQARVKPLSIGTNGFVGLLARSSGSTVFYRLALLPGRAELQAVQGSAVTVLGSSSRTVANGTWYTLSITTSGSAVTGSIDGAQFASGSSSLSAAGRIGLQTSYSSASFDDVTVTTGGTTPPPTPTPSPTRPTPTPTGPSTPTPTPTDRRPRRPPPRPATPAAWSASRP